MDPLLPALDLLSTKMDKLQEVVDKLIARAKELRDENLELRKDMGLVIRNLGCPMDPEELRVQKLMRAKYLEKAS